MNQFLSLAKQAITAHGESCSYIKVQPGVYNVATGEVTNAETITTVTVYRKHLKATQYNYPNLVGKDATLIYLTADSVVDVPTVNDKFTFGTSTYTVDSIQEHRAFNEVVLYRIACYKG